MAQVVSWFSGLETGDAAELDVLGAGASIVTTPVNSGGYSLKQADTATSILPGNGLAATKACIRFAIRLLAVNGGTIQICMPKDVSNAVLCNLNLIAGILEIQDSGGASMGISTTSGTTALVANQWYYVDFVCDFGLNGIIKVWLNGNLEISITHTTAVTVYFYYIQGDAAGSEYFFDDMRIDSGGLTRIGAGRCIARQGKTGAPTYNAWTKNGAATSALCWSDTPFSAATNCTNAVSANAQTMLVAPFSATQSGHGKEVIGAIDTVNACKTAIVGKAAVASSGKIRRRVNGADTDTAITYTTADAYYDDGIWTTTVANLDLLEAGAVHALDVNVETIEDAWVIVDFTDVLLPQAVM